MDIDRIIRAFEARPSAHRARIEETVRLWIEGAAARRSAERGAAATPYPAFAARLHHLP